MTATEKQRAAFADRVAEACAHAFTAARIAATEIETVIEPRLPSGRRVLSEKLRADVRKGEIVSEDFRGRLADLLAAIGEVIQAETKVVTTAIEDAIPAPGKAPSAPGRDGRSADDRHGGRARAGRRPATRFR